MAKDNAGAGFSLKDHLFNRERVQYLARLFASSSPDFDAKRFVRLGTKPFKQLELKQRITHLAQTLEDFLPAEFDQSAKQIVAALPPPLDPKKTDDDFGDFIFAPLGEFVVRNGMQRKHLRLSLRTIREITQRFSMEYAIRHFINHHTDATLNELEKWSTHKNYHVRRLVSEGTRPSLPWSGKVSIDIETPLPFLDTLHADPTRYVTRSVANHLNDISKVAPKTVVQRLKSWKKLKQQDASELQWISKHALRTLVKQGHQPALQFLGYRANPQVEVFDFEIATPSIKRGEAFEFSFRISAKRPEPLMVDYVLDFVKADGSLAPKVFKLKQLDLDKSEDITIKKRHRLLANATTYKVYPGTHRVTLQINGKPFGTQEFKVR